MRLVLQWKTTSRRSEENGSHKEGTKELTHVSVTNGAFLPSSVTVLYTKHDAAYTSA